MVGMETQAIGPDIVRVKWLKFPQRHRLRRQHAGVEFQEIAVHDAASTVACRVLRPVEGNRRRIGDCCD
jgi:hypothetical protein